MPKSLYTQAQERGALLFHHCRPLAHCHYDLAVPVRLTQVLPYPVDCGDGPYCRWDDWHDALHMEAAYRWLASEVGFWPLFLAVGDDEEALRMAGYDNQFGRVLSRSREGTTYRQAGDFPSDVLFSFCQAPARIRFSDYSNWHLALNSTYDADRHQRYCQLTAYEGRLILRPSWSESDWMRLALKEPHSVQAVVPFLDLRQADHIRCRSLAAKRALVARGFPAARVEVARLKVRRWW